MHRSTLSEILKLKDSVGRFIWQEFSDGPIKYTIFGIPVICCSSMPQIASSSSPVIFGDFYQGYKIVQNKTMKIMRDPYTKKGFVNFYTSMRVGGDVVDHKALKAISMPDEE